MTESFTGPASPRPTHVWARLLWTGVTAGLLWLVVGGVAQALRWFTRFGSLLEPVVPSTMPGNVWVWPGAWGYLAALLGALAVAGVTIAILAVQARGASFGWVMVGRTWLAVIIAATVGGIASDIAGLFGFGPVPGIGEGLSGRLSIADLGTDAASGAYFGVLYGWIVALLMRASARRAGHGAPASDTAVSGVTTVAGHDPDHAAELVTGDARGRSRAAQPSKLARLRAAISVFVAAVLVIGYTVVSAAGARVHTEVTQTAIVQAERDAAEAAGIPSVGALPDPGSEGEAVPVRDDSAALRDPAWCADEDSTLIFDGPDAATGHRLLMLHVVNGGDSPCVLEGYPDIVFADQNGHLLDAEITPGSSFMRQDTGPVKITLEPGAFASSGIGWNANSTHGALVAAEVYGALVPGDTRHSWPPRSPLDIVPGSEVAVTAWALSDGPQPD